MDGINYDYQAVRYYSAENTNVKLNHKNNSLIIAASLRNEDEYE